MTQQRAREEEEEEEKVPWYSEDGLVSGKATHLTKEAGTMMNRFFKVPRKGEGERKSPGAKGI